MSDQFEMPTPCQHCGELFELTEGCGYAKWYPNTVICDKCFYEEEKEIEKDEEIEEAKELYNNAVVDIQEAIKTLNELGVKVISIQIETI